MTQPSQVHLVTGGAGFIGSALVRQLLEDGLPVVVYDNFSFGHTGNLPEHERLTWVEGDINDTVRLEQTFRHYRPTTVYHLAALHFIPYCLAHPDETLRVNVEGTLQVLEACKRQEVPTVVYASTAAVYTISNTPHQESDRLEPLEIYGASKLCGEHLVSLFYRETGAKCAIARLFNGYGERETNPHVIPEILKQLLATNDRVELGNVKPQRDFIHTSDIARALRSMAAGDFTCATFNVATGTGRSVEELVLLIARLRGQPIDIVSRASRRRKLERFSLVGDITKIKHELGWTPQVSPETGFRELLEAEGLLPAVSVT